MPELPEAETICRTLGPHVEGRRITAAKFFTARVRLGSLPELNGRTVRRIHRYGKQVVADLDRGHLVIQLRMTGLLLWNRSPGAHTRAVLEFPHGHVCFDDIRQFGSIRWLEAPPDHLGPDPLEIPPDAFHRHLRRHRSQLKRLLLDQNCLRGLGNIYVDEILHRARLHPRTRTDRLGPARTRRLHEAMRAILTSAIKAGGSSISDYVDANGRKGTFQLQHQVYGKAGVPCPRCATPIRRILASQRGTHYCPRCQRM